MLEQNSAEYKKVRGLIRGINLLNALNRIDGGATPSQLSHITGLHRTTVRRILETLQEEGYIYRSPSDDRFKLSIKVRELSEGFRDEQWIAGLGAPLLGELLQKVVWPTDICTLDVDAMVVRETTHRFSRLSFHRSMIGRRLPMLITAAGRAYIAHCPESEREKVLKILIARNDQQSEFAKNPTFIEGLINKTRRQGYAENKNYWQDEPKISAIAIPIKHHERVMGCLNLIYIAKAMTTEEAAKKYLPSMQAMVAKLEQEISESELY